MLPLSQLDFNAAGTAFEKLTGIDIYDALEADLAKPLGMQDFDRARQKKNDERPHTVHPEYAMYLSTRDMARIGLLMLREGKWGDKDVLPPSWSRYITTIVTPYRDMNPPFLSLLTRPWRYGVMWWVWDAQAWSGLSSGPFQGAYTAWGANGQFITVLPTLDMVVAHKVNDGTSEYEVTQFEFQTILQMLISANCGSGNECWP